MFIKTNLLGLLKSPATFLGLGFGSGLVAFAPGTFGTLAAIPLFLLFHDLSFFAYGVLVLAGFFVGIPICNKAVADLNKNGSPGHDHPCIVWDEVVGFLLTMMWIDVSLFSVVLGFILFRFFDIIKPWPIKLIDQRVGGGFGIMLDDIVAGIFANCLLRFAVYLYG